MADTHSELNVLFGLCSAATHALTRAQISDACKEWAQQPDSSLADMLAARGLLSHADRTAMERLVALSKTQAEAGQHFESDATVAENGGPRPGSKAAKTDVTFGDSLARESGRRLVGTEDLTSRPSNRYTLSRLHARGGIGQVWLALDSGLGREVALKELRPECASNPSFTSRFLKEARITGQLEHPSIVPIYELGTNLDQNGPYYTMRFIRGPTLSQAIASYHELLEKGVARPLEFRELLNAFVAICNAVAYAHSRGVIHRDLKPQNVVLGKYGEVILLDWGLAKRVDHPDSDEAVEDVPIDGHPQPSDGGTESDTTGTLDRSATADDKTHEGQVVGTPAYMSPEQAEGRVADVDGRTDVYGLGAILYEILTGRCPYSGASTKHILKAVIEGRPARARDLVPETPAALECICLRAMEKRPGDRYASPGELAADVRNWLADEPVSAHAETIWVRGRRWLRRHQTLAAVLSVMALMAVISLGLGLAWQSQARLQLQQAFDDLATAQLKEVGARRQAEAHRNQAEENFKLARKAVDEYFTEVSRSKELLGGSAGTQELQRRLLQRAKDYYQDFLKRHIDDTDLSLQIEGAKAHSRLAAIAYQLGDMHTAVAETRSSVAVWQKLTELEPENASHWKQLAGYTHNLGVMHQDMGDTKSALSAYEKGRDIRLRFLKDHPDDAGWRNDLAASYNAMALLLEQLGRIAEGLELLDKAIEIRETLVREQTSESRYKLELSYLYGNSIGFNRSLGRLQKAVDRAEANLALRKALFAESPKDQHLRREIASAHRALSSILEATDALDRAARELDAGKNICEQLVTENPAVPQYKLDLGSHLNQEARLHERRQDIRQAVACQERIITLLEPVVKAHVETPQYAEAQAQAYMNVGYDYLVLGELAKAESRLVLAREIWTVLSTKHPNVQSYSRALAGCYLQLGRLSKDLAHFSRARSWIEKGRDILERMLKAQPNPDLESSLGVAHWYLAECIPSNSEAAISFQKGIEIHERLIQQIPKAARYKNNLAMIQNAYSQRLATCGDERVRNPSLAIQLASRACETSNWKNSDYLDGLALAHADAGDFKRALEYVTKALELAAKGSLEEKRYGEHKLFFERKQPIRQTMQDR